MPIYEYACVKCEGEFEELVRSSDEKVECPDCGSKRVKRKMSVFGFKSGNTFVSAHGGCSGDCSGCSSCSGSSSCSSCN